MNAPVEPDPTAKPHPASADVFVGVSGTVWKRRGPRSRSSDKWKVLKPFFDKDGYARIPVCGAKIHVHRLVYLIHRGPLIAGLVVCHLDGDRTNNHANNLLQTTQKENIGHKRLHGTHQIGEKHPKALMTNAKAEQVARAVIAAERSKANRMKHGEAQRISAELGVSIYAVYNFSRARGCYNVDLRN